MDIGNSKGDTFPVTFTSRREHEVFAIMAPFFSIEGWRSFRSMPSVLSMFGPKFFDQYPATVPLSRRVLEHVAVRLQDADQEPEVEPDDPLVAIAYCHADDPAAAIVQDRFLERSIALTLEGHREIGSDGT